MSKRGEAEGHDHDEAELMRRHQAQGGGAAGEGRPGQRGGRAHTSTEDGHPELDRSSSRSARDLGGPSIAPDDLDDAPEATGGAEGESRTGGQPSQP